MSKKLWFKAKTYGWGWVPCSYEGWLVIALYIAILVYDFIRIDSTSHSNSDTLRPFVIDVFLLTLILIAICKKKGEKPRWSWGANDEKKK